MLHTFLSRSSRLDRVSQFLQEDYRITGQFPQCLCVAQINPRVAASQVSPVFQCAGRTQIEPPVDRSSLQADCSHSSTFLNRLHAPADRSVISLALLPAEVSSAGWMGRSPNSLVWTVLLSSVNNSGEQPANHHNQTVCVLLTVTQSRLSHQ
ncbi:uncharacterized protein BDV14DRAFT_171129 [Aspergillus stella-maris]|uniref:uncharacterized protein n=1 Tax=Aspergillus stella-maris TaxID=1810926 RepID=UPI003CCDE96B